MTTRKKYPKEYKLDAVSLVSYKIRNYSAYFETLLEHPAGQLVFTGFMKTWRFS